jgi:ABC-type transport system substrate-binding protein
VLPGGLGRSGGRSVVALRAEPKTLNPLIAIDAPSREVIGTMQADLVHINRVTQLTEPAIAKSWKVSRDGLRYTLVLRRGLKFSDGYPLDVDGVLFTLRVYLYENVHASQRELLIFEGKPLKKLYDRTQELLWEYQPMIFLASPDILTGAKKSVGNFRPAVLEPYVLWNVDRLYLKNDAVRATP